MYTLNDVTDLVNYGIVKYKNLNISRMEHKFAIKQKNS